MKKLPLFVCCALILPIFSFASFAAPPDVPENAAKSYVLMEASTGKILAEKDSHTKYHPASMTKIMTMLLVAESVDSGAFTLDDTATASEHAKSMGGSQIFLAPGEQMTIRDLLKAVAVASANDAAVCLAEFVCGSEQEFVDQMNAKAQYLGMTDTHFVNACGLDADGHVSSAHDVAIMSRELLSHTWITEFTTIWMDSLRGGATSLANTNKMIHYYSGITGLKTGFTNGAKYCVSASAERNGMQLIAVVMGGETSELRFGAAGTLLDYGFAKYAVINPMSLVGEELPEIPVKNGKADSVPLELGGAESILLSKDEVRGVTKSIELSEYAEAPVEKGAKLGEVVVMSGETELARVPLLAACAVERIGFGDILWLMLGRILFCAPFGA